MKMELIALVPSLVSGIGYVCFARDASTGERRVGYGATYLSAWDDASTGTDWNERCALESCAALSQGLLDWECAR